MSIGWIIVLVVVYICGFIATGVWLVQKHWCDGEPCRRCDATVDLIVMWPISVVILSITRPWRKW